MQSHYFLRRERRRHRFATFERHAGQIPRWRQAEALAVAPKDGFGGVEPAYRSFSRVAVKTRTRQIVPNASQLLRIALVFSVGLDHFFSDEKDRHTFAVTRKKERLRFREMPGADDIAFDFESLDFLATDRKFNAYLAEFHELPTEKIRLRQHPGVHHLRAKGQVGVR